MQVQQVEINIRAGDDTAAVDRAVGTASKWWYLTPTITTLASVAFLISGVVWAGLAIHNATHTSGNQYNDSTLNAASKATLGTGVTIVGGLALSVAATLAKGIMDSAQAVWCSTGGACCRALTASWKASWSEFGKPEGIMINSVKGPVLGCIFVSQAIGND